MADPVYLTTREVAALLRVKERKVYDLAAAGEIPHRRTTGKLLFPRDEITRWIGGEKPAAETTARPAIVAGSHDPLLEWTVRESGSGLAMLFDGSLDGLDRFAAGEVALCGLHLPEDQGWNIATVAAREPRNCVLIAWATRARGLLFSEGVRGEIGCFTDLRGRKVVARQPGAGAAALFERLCAQAGLEPGEIETAPGVARTEVDAAAAVASGEADAAIGVAAMARQYHLGFLPLVAERFDLLVDRRSYFESPVQALLSFARTAAFSEKAAAMEGYGLAEAGSVRWISP